MELSDVFKSSSLKAADLAGREVTLTIAGFKSQDFDDGTKLILSFQETDKDLICNKTNANTIKDMYGGTIDNWVGRQITLIQSQTDYGGKQVPCIRVKIGQAPSQQPTELPGTPRRPANPLAGEIDSGEIPF